MTRALATSGTSPIRGRFAAPIIVIVAAVAASGGVAAVFGVAPRDLLVVLALTAAGAVIVTILGIGLRYLVGRRTATIGAQSALAAGLTAAATLAAFAMVSATQLNNEHDLAVILSALPLAAGAGVAYGVASGRRVTADLLALAAAVRTIEPGTEPDLSVPARVTEVETIAEALRMATARLAEATERQQSMEASRRDLVAWASHDLRTPLAGLRVLAEALADEVATDEEARRHYLASLTANVDRLAALVDDLFELAQIEAGGLSLQKEPTHLPTLVADVVDSFLPSARAAEVMLSFTPTPVAPVVVDGDKIGRVVANLVDNAIRHTPPGGSVTVHVEEQGAVDGQGAVERGTVDGWGAVDGRGAVEQGGGVRVSVQDGCGGIPPDELPLIFDRMWRGDPARAAGGSGLGLAIAKGLVEAHGGTIDAGNAADGCRIGFLLPR